MNVIQARPLGVSGSACSSGSDRRLRSLPQIKAMVQAPEIIVATWREARRTIKTLTERQVREELQNFEDLRGTSFSRSNRLS